MTKEYWITNSRFKFIAVILLIIFLTLMTLIYFKADEITKDPCSVCSKRIGEEVLCMTTGTPTLTRTYFPNGSISNDVLR